MPLALKVRQVGNSLGVVLPREAVRRMRLDKGETVFITEMPDGGYRLTPYDPEFSKQMKLASKGMTQYRNTLRALAK